MFCLLVMGEGSPHVVDNWPERQVMADHETTEVSGEASLRNNFLSKNSFLSFPYQKESTIKSYFSRLGFDKYVKPLPRGRKVGRHVVLHQLCFLFGGGEAFYLALLYILQDLSFLTRNWTWGVSSESKESWPLDCHGLPGVSYVLYIYIWDFPGGSDGKASAYNAGDPVRSLGWEDPLEKEMATHSTILAWKIPWTEDPGRLQSMGSQRVRHDWVTSLHIYL